MYNVSIYSICFSEKDSSSHLIVFIDKILKIFLFANDKYTFVILANELIGNIIQINTKCIHIF